MVATHVAWRSGAAIDLAALGSRRRDASWALLVDAAQSAGAVPLAPYTGDIDFIGFPGYKWLLGPPGIGYLVIGAGWLDEPSPISGWAAVKDFPVDVTEFKPLPGGAGVRYGMPSFIPLAGSPGGTAAHQPGRDRTDRRPGRLPHGLAAEGARRPRLRPGHSAPGERAGWRALGRGPQPAAAVAALAEHRIATMPELQYIRLDLHAFNTEEGCRPHPRLLRGLAWLSQSGYSPSDAAPVRQDGVVPESRRPAVGIDALADLVHALAGQRRPRRNCSRPATYPR